MSRLGECPDRPCARGQGDRSIGIRRNPIVQALLKGGLFLDVERHEVARTCALPAGEGHPQRFEILERSRDVQGHYLGITQPGVYEGRS